MSLKSVYLQGSNIILSILIWSDKLISPILHEQFVSEAQETKSYQNYLKYLRGFYE